MASDIKTLLTGTPISSILPNRPLVYLDSTASISDVLELLSKHSILSAPVFAAGASDGAAQPSIGTLLGFVDVWAVLVAFLQSLPGAPGSMSAEQLEAHGAKLCQRPVMALLDGSAAVKAALESGGEAQVTCADWEMTDDPNTSLLEVIRTCFLPRMQPQGANSLQSYGSGMGFMVGASPRVSSSQPGANSTGGAAAGTQSPHAPGWSGGHSRHPAASHRIVVALPDGSGGDRLAVLSQSDILRFLAAHHDCLRPLGKCSLAELGLANGSLHLAAGPTTAGGNSASCSRPPPLSPAAHAPPFGGAGAGGGGGASAGGGSCWGGLPGTPPSHSHMPAIPSSPKPPLGRSSLDLTPGGGGERQDRSILSSSPVGDSAPILSIGLQRGGSGGLGPNNFNSSGGTGGAGGGGPVMMQMSPPASPRVSASHMMARGGSLGGASGHGHRGGARRQLVAVHESVTVLEALRVLLQQRVSAVAVLAGSGPSPNMRLVGNLSASDLRHLRKGGFGGLALSVKAFLASKPLAPDQAIRVSPPPCGGEGAAGAGGSKTCPPAFIMAHAPTCFTSQATASLEELIKMLGGRCAGIHRVYVVDPDQRPAGVVTTTDVLQLLSCACSKE